MKKFLIILIAVLLLLSAAGICFAVKYKKELALKQDVIDALSTVSSDLNEEVGDLKRKNEFLESDASSGHPIEIKAEECMEKEKYTVQGIAKCLYASVNDWETEINKDIELFRKGLPRKEFRQLQKSQREWEKYRKAQWKLNNSITGKKNDTIYTMTLAKEQSNLVKQRAKELDSLYSIFSKP